MAAYIGVLRRIQSKTTGLKNNHGYEGTDPWQTDIEAAGAELAVSKALNLHWNAGVNTFRAPDIGENLQVRWTPLITGSLILRETDGDLAYYVLVVGCMPDMQIAGFIRGRDGKKGRWLKSPGGRPPAYFVPQEALRPLDHLRSVKTTA